MEVHAEPGKGNYGASLPLAMNADGGWDIPARGIAHALGDVEICKDQDDVMAE
jgi:hypothetical protein